MNNIFIGLLLVFLDFNITLGGHVIGLIPDFIGYYFVMKGMDALSAECPRYMKLRPIALGMAVYSAAMYALNVFGLFTGNGVLTGIIGAAALAVSLYLYWGITMGVVDIETLYGCDLNGEKLKKMWIGVAVCGALAYVLVFVPLLATICIIADFVFEVIFLVYIYRAKNAYDDMKLSGTAHTAYAGATADSTAAAANAENAGSTASSADTADAGSDAGTGGVDDADDDDDGE